MNILDGPDVVRNNGSGANANQNAPPVCLSLRLENPYRLVKLVSLLEILRANVDVYVAAAFSITGAACFPQTLSNDVPYQQLEKNLIRLREECDLVGLDVTKSFLDDLLRALEGVARFDPERVGLSSKMLHIQETLIKELSQRVFLQVPNNRAALFDYPRNGWDEVIEAFPDAVSDVEEMCRCFALSRYAASVFHSVQIIEHGLLKLGVFLEVNDPKSGWTAVAGKLKKIVDTKHGERTPFQQSNFPLIEQLQGTVESLKNAWRNKISHAQERLVVLSSEFAPDTAEEIRLATRGFMRKLAVDLPGAIIKP